MSFVHCGSNEPSWTFNTWPIVGPLLEMLSERYFVFNTGLAGGAVGAGDAGSWCGHAVDALQSEPFEFQVGGDGGGRFRQYASFEHGFTGIGLAQLVGRRKELRRVVKSAAAAVCARHRSPVVRRTLFRCPPQLCRFFFRKTAVLHSSRPTSSPFIIVDRRSFFLHFQRLHPSRLTSGPYASSLYSFSSAQCYSGCDLLLVDCKYTRVLSFGRRHIDRS